RVLTQTCFIQESQKYPDGFRPLDVLRIAEGLHPAWDHELARELVSEFRLPEKRVIKKLSRGQLSAVGIIVGLASRAPLTFFDEPYLGLDAVARRLFFDRLLADFSAHPRTVILSTHHIDEVSGLLEHVVLLDQGRVEISAETDELCGAAIEVSGDSRRSGPSSPTPTCSTSRSSARSPPQPSTPSRAARSGPAQPGSGSPPSRCRTTSSTAPPPRPPRR